MDAHGILARDEALYKCNRNAVILSACPACMKKIDGPAIFGVFQSLYHGFPILAGQSHGAFAFDERFWNVGHL